MTDLRGGLTKEQREHALDVMSEFIIMFFNKYRKGAKEHGGVMTEIAPADLLDMAIDEAIDQVCYLITMRQNMKKGKGQKCTK